MESKTLNTLQVNRRLNSTRNRIMLTPLREDEDRRDHAEGDASRNAVVPAVSRAGMPCGKPTTATTDATAPNPLTADTFRTLRAKRRTALWHRPSAARYPRKYAV
jgi:hypothetical protein